MTGRREAGSDMRVEGLRREKVVFNFFAAKKELRVLRGACFLAGVSTTSGSQYVGVDLELTKRPHLTKN